MVKAGVRATNKWQKDYDKAYAGYKAKGFSDQQAWSWACDRANAHRERSIPLMGVMIARCMAPSRREPS